MESKRRSEGIRKERLYALAVLIYVLMILGTVGAYDFGSMTFGELAYQIGILAVGGIWWWYLIRLEETRAATSRRARR